MRPGVARTWIVVGALPTLPAMPANPCTTCGACCASFRVDFSRDELEADVPAGLAVEVNDTTCRMRGTDHAWPRCAALVGRVGIDAHCGIYEWRPGPCREFGMLAPLGVPDDACTRARARHGLPPLQAGPSAREDFSSTRRVR
jgi:Fe-S-cluster containining protein